MAKTMKEYYNELLNSIPSPETLQQMKLAENIEKVMDGLTRNGHYYFTSCGCGSRESEVAMVTKIIKIFEAKGYHVNYYIYSKSNSSVFWCDILM